MSTNQLTRKLKASNIPETLTIRLHRAISWLKSAEKQDDNLDLKFISLWIAFNACYAVATLGASLDEFAGDLKAILDAKLKNL